MDLTALVAALDALVLERLPDGLFAARGQVPEWCHRLAREGPGRALRSGEPVAIGALFPVLDIFFPQAEPVWRTGGERAVSDFWTEAGVDDDEIHLEATAVLADGVRVLLISRREASFRQHQRVLQRARELRLVHDALTREVEHKDILLHTIVHDLASPLQSIVGALELLVELKLPAQAARWTDIANRAAARQSELIAAILDVFQTEHGALTGPLDPHGVDLVAAIERARYEREPVARRHGVEVVAPAPQRVRVAAEDTRLLRVLANLLDNAIRHSPTGATVRITVEVEADVVVIAVEDEGPGVSQEVLPRLFQKLAHDLGSRGGTGLGLYFCRITVERWAGSIGYAERPEKGARFWVRLPLASAPDADGSRDPGR